MLCYYFFSATLLNVLVILLAVMGKVKEAPFLAALQILCSNLVITALVSLSIVSSAVAGGWVLRWPVCVLTGIILFLKTITRLYL